MLRRTRVAGSILAISTTQGNIRSSRQTVGKEDRQVAGVIPVAQDWCAEGGCIVMPFKSAKQEVAMQINSPATWKKWVKRYGHHPGYRALMRKSAKKAAKTRKRRRQRGG